jgi:transposase-like protein
MLVVSMHGIPDTTTETELMDDRHKRDGRGRRIADPQRREEIVAGYAGSGLTQKAYARREGVNYHTLVSWLGRSRRDSAAIESPRRPSEAATPVPQFARLSWPPTAPASAARLEVVLPDGVLLRGEDPAALLILLNALAPRRPC